VTSAVVGGSRVAVVAELAALDVGHVAQEHDARLKVVAVLHEVAAGAELEVVAYRGGGVGDL
jgi:hypothetical protein